MRHPISILTTLFLVGALVAHVPAVNAQEASSGYPIVTVMGPKGHELFVHPNPTTGSAHRVYGGSIKLADYGLNFESLAEADLVVLAESLVEDYGKILGFGIGTLTLNKIIPDKRFFIASFVQALNGLQVYGTKFGFLVDNLGRIMFMGADVYSEGAANATTPFVSERAAFSIAATNTSNELRAFDHNSAQLILYPQESEGHFEFRIAWYIAISDYVVIVDGLSGIILEQTLDGSGGHNSNLKVIAHSVGTSATPDTYGRDQMGKPTYSLAQKSEDTYSVSGTVSGEYWPLYSDDTEVSTPLTDGTTVILKQYPSWSTVDTEYTDSNGDYEFTGVSAGYYRVTVQYVNDWVSVEINDQSIAYYTTGTFQVSNSDVDKDIPIDVISVTRPYPDALYHITKIHNYFTDTQGYAGLDFPVTARFISSADTNGWSYLSKPVIKFGRQDSYEWGEHTHALYHEYTHQFIRDVYTYGRISEDGSDYMGLAMDEGIPDYFAASITGNPDIFDGFSGHVREINDTFVYPTHFTGCSTCKYDNSKIFSGALWDVRHQVLGAALTDELVMLTMYTQADEFVEFSLTLVLWENYLRGSTNIEDIENELGGHGIAVPELDAGSMSGDSYADPYEEKTWSMGGVSGGYPSYSYYWEYYPRCETRSPTCYQWHAAGSTTSSIDFENEGDDFDLRCTVTDYLDREDSHTLQISVGGAKRRDESVDRVTGTDIDIPDTYSLSSNYPNPFNPVTTIRFGLPTVSKVSLTIVDAAGREVEQLFNGTESAGYHEIQWDARLFPSGVYFYQIIAGDYSETRSMVLLK